MLKAADVPAWFVGGYVRDQLLGRSTNDVDFALLGDGIEWARRVADRFDGAFVPLDRARGVGRVVFRRSTGTLYLDFARLRAPTLKQDLLLRDFTVNALAVDVGSGELIDDVGGYNDLNRFRLRLVDEAAFRDDPLRLLRAVRLAAVLKFTITGDTLALMHRDAHLLSRSAAERVRDELLKLLGTEAARAYLPLLDELTLLRRVLPELEACHGLGQPAPYTLDVYGHTLNALAALERMWPWRHDQNEGHPDAWQEPVLRHRAPLTTYLREEVAFEQPRWLLLKLALLLHDVGKPATQSEDGAEGIHFPEHEWVGARLATRRLRALRLPASSVRWVGTVVRQHRRPRHMAQTSAPSRRALYRFFRDAGDTAPAIALLALADHGGRERRQDSALTVVADRIWSAFFTPDTTLIAPKPLLNGNDLQALGIPPGPTMGNILERLQEEQAMGTVQTRTEAERFVLRLREQQETGHQ